MKTRIKRSDVLLGESQHTPEMKCPNCGVTNDAASGLGHNDSPKPGDIAICIDCASILIYTPFDTLRIATPDDLSSFPVENQVKIAVAVAATKHVITQRKKRSH